MNEDKGTRYQRARRRTSLAFAAWTAGLLLMALSSGDHLRLRDRFSSLFESFPYPWFRVVPVALLCAAVLALMRESGRMPLAFFGHYAVDRRYGVVSHGPGVWLRHQLAESVSAVAIALVMTAVVYTCLLAWPAVWWLPAWGLLTCISVVTAWGASAWLLPRFARLAPAGRAGVTERLEALSQRLGVPALGVFAWPSGHGANQARATLAGVGRHRRILVSDTLLADYSDDEIEVILAHEMAHHVRHDGWRALAVEAAVLAIALWAGAAALERLGPAFGLRDPADPAGLPLLALAMALVKTAGVPLGHARSRAAERRADRFALDHTGKPDALVSAIRRLAARNLADEHPSAWERACFYSHPPAPERLALARTWAARRSA
jgi:STE24 endopeptidase